MFTRLWTITTAIMERIRLTKPKMISSLVMPTIKCTLMQNATKVYKTIWKKYMAYFLIHLRNKLTKNLTNFSRKLLKISLLYLTTTLRKNLPEKSPITNPNPNNQQKHKNKNLLLKTIQKTFTPNFSIKQKISTTLIQL